MRASELNKLFEEICSYGLTPNEYFALAMVLQNKPLQERMEFERYRRYLYVNDWIDMKNKATNKVKESKIFDEIIDTNFRENIEKYRSMWPAITLPTGKTARSSSKELEDRFKWFFNNYDHDWEMIFKATENYITFYAERGYAFMRTSSYFICKYESLKIRTSTLAEWCDRIKDGVEEKDYHIDV